MDFRDSTQHYLLTNELPEKAERKFLKSLIRPSDICFDVGAGHGLYSVTFSKLAHKVIAFEPIPTMALRVTCLKAKVELIESALYDIDCNREIFDNKDASGFSEWKKGKAQKRMIRCITPDLLLPPDIVAIDVCGSEYRVLKGLFPAFERENPPIIMWEHVPEAVEANCMGYNDCKALLEASKAKYEFFCIPRNEDHFWPLFPPHVPPFYCMMFAIPACKKDRLHNLHN